MGQLFLNKDKIINLENIKYIGVTLRLNKPTLREHFAKIKEVFSRHNINILLDEQSALMIQEADTYLDTDLDNIETLPLEKMCSKSDMLVCCGGDGTLLNLVLNSFSSKKPILGISGGNLSFLLNVKIQNLDSFVQNMFLNKFEITEHMMLKLDYQNDNEEKRFHIFNDVVFKSENVFKIVNLNLLINNEPINSYNGDGLIVSTPTGSTAYNLSAKGPIVHPLNKAIIVTPICPHGLTQNPLVLPCNFDISIQSPNGDGVAIIDGHSQIKINKKTKINISISKYKVNMLHGAQNEYIKSLKEKLLWGV